MNPELQSQYGRLTSALNSSPTARTGNQMPSMRDINTEQQLKKTIAQIEGEKDKRLRERWYGEGSQTEKSDSAAPPVGLFSRTVNALTAPLYAGIGALDYATGQSRGRSLTEAMNKNVSEDRRLWGDVLEGTKLPGIIRKPLGLTLDIVTDPVNIATAGTGGILARMMIGGQKGFVKGGISGAAKGIRYGAESRALETALVAKAITLGGTSLAVKTANAVNPLRWMGKVNKMDSAAAVTKTSGALEKRLTTATKSYDEIVGTNAIQRAIDDKQLGGYFYRTLQDGAKKVGDQFPAAREFFEKYLIYDNENWSRVARIRDAMLEHSTQTQVNNASKAFVRTYKEGGTVDDALLAAREQITLTPDDLATTDSKLKLSDSPFEDPAGIVKQSQLELNKAVAALANKSDTGVEDLLAVSRVADDSVEAAQIMRNPDAYVTQDVLETQFRLFAEATQGSDAYARFANQLEAMIKAGDPGYTGVAWWDNMKASVNKFKETVKTKKSLSDPNITIQERVGQKVAQFLDTYDLMMAFFRRGKVGASARAWTNAVFGNLAMAKMNGIDILDPAYMKSFRQSFNVVTGKSSSELLLNELAEVSDLIPMVKANPSQFEFTTGISREEPLRIQQLQNLMNQFKKVGVDAGVMPKTATNTEVLDAMEGILRTAGEAVGATDNQMYDLAKTWATRRKQTITGAAGRKLESIDPKTGKAGDVLGTDIVSNEFFNSDQANKIFKRLADASKQEGNYAAKLGNFMFNTMPDGYGKIDHVYKMSGVVYTTKYGVKEHELRQIARAIDLSGTGDVEEIIVDGVSRYRLSAAKSFELANETFLNYAAMPAAVKVIRQMPLVGAPFVAFTYGMYGKVMKALIKNPAFFTKQHYALEELSGDTSPVERALLSMERYQYLNDPAMFKLNLPGNHMIYANLANVLPYMSLSLTQPSARSFEAVLPNAVTQLVDRSPILKDPVGQMIFDYFLLPAMLSEEIPLGAFGQPVYPTDPSLAERIGLPARTLADSFMPGVAEMGLGLATPTSVADFAPGYLTRKISQAKEGKTPLGVQSKEPAMSRLMRALGSGVGVPIQTPVPHAYLQEDEIADKLNQ